MHHSLCILEHFLSPQIEEVAGIRVEFQPELAILSVKKKIVIHNLISRPRIRYIHQLPWRSG